MRREENRSIYGAVWRGSLGMVVAVGSSNSLTNPTWRQFLCPAGTFPSGACTISRLKGLHAESSEAGADRRSGHGDQDDERQYSRGLNNEPKSRLIGAYRSEAHSRPSRAQPSTSCWPPSMSYVAPVIAVLVIRCTASAAMSAGPTTRLIGSVLRSCSRRDSS
jgi:hypothetical protein